MFTKSFIKKTVIFICTLTIIFSNTITVCAYEYLKQETNDYEINENITLSEKEIDDIRESLQDEEDSKTSQDDFDDEDNSINNEELDNLEETSYNDLPIISSFPLLESSDESLNTFDIETSISSIFDGYYITGKIEPSIDNYGFDYLNIYEVGSSNVLESINDLQDNNTFSSSLFDTYDFDTYYQYKIEVFYSKEVKDNFGNPTIDPNHYKEVNSQKIYGVEFDYIFEQSCPNHYSIIPNQYTVNGGK